MPESLVRIGTLVFVALSLPTIGFAQIKKEQKYSPDDPAATWKEADSIDGRWNETNIGPFLASVLGTPSGTVAKGLSIRVGDRQQGAVGYDLKTMSFKVAWTGAFLKFNPRRYAIVNAPAIAGSVQFANSQPGWQSANVKYHGLYQSGARVTLAYSVDGVEVRESPWLEVRDGKTIFTRSFEIAPHDKPLSFSVCDNNNEVVAAGPVFRSKDNRSIEGTCVASSEPQRFTVKVARGPQQELDDLARTLSQIGPPDASIFRGQPSALWPQQITTKGKVGEDKAAYVIDTITVPFENPFKALMFLSGHDFFSNGDAAACTLHGDVWLIRGMDQRLEKVTWRRYATGLHQPLGLRIVQDRIFVLGRDQITRLHDRNDDGEADFYENFNNDGQTSQGGHDFAACLETDPEGNFYYIRAHEGVCRVTRDGSQHEAIATGFRNPIGLGVGPDGTVTAAPQEGNWTPASFIAEIKRGGYYGYGGPKVTAQRPLGYDPPLCWIPRENDGSSGGQVWVTSDRWGPLKGQMLHFSYGRCQMCLVLREKVGDVAQGGTIKFPLVFESGVMRGRFGPHDGQLYVSGLRGWQCAATKDGCLQRVRYTGKPVDMPTELHVRNGGVAIQFTRPLDQQEATDPDNYHVEQWNYHYTGNYGSKDYRVSDARQTGRDEVEVLDVKWIDDRTVLLELDNVQPVMQMGITYSIKASDGAAIRHTIYNTINAVPPR